MNWRQLSDAAGARYAYDPRHDTLLLALADGEPPPPSDPAWQHEGGLRVARAADGAATFAALEGVQAYVLEGIARELARALGAGSAATPGEPLPPAPPSQPSGPPATSGEPTAEPPSVRHGSAAGAVAPPKALPPRVETTSAPVEDAAALIAAPAPVEDVVAPIATPAPVEDVAAPIAAPAPVEDAAALIAAPAPVEDVAAPIATPAPATEPAAGAEVGAPTAATPEAEIEALQPTIEAPRPAVESPQATIEAPRPGVETAQPAIESAQRAAETPQPAAKTAPPAVEVASARVGAAPLPPAPEPTAEAATPDAVPAEARLDPTEPTGLDAAPTKDASTETPASEAVSFGDLGLHPTLLAALAAAGFEEPTEIQRRAVPVALGGADLVGLSQTGSGKTLAFLLPGLSRLMRESRDDHAPRMLVVTPTRELALQIAEEAETLVAHSGVRVATVFGGRAMKSQTNQLRRGADVVVATPGRLLDHVRRRNARLDAVEVFVLDEADRMLDMGFVDDIRHIARHLPPNRQTLLFGATLPPEIQLLSADFQRSPEVVEVARRMPPTTIEQLLYPVGPHLKSGLLMHLLRTDPAMVSVLVFMDTKREADIVTRQLREGGFSVAVMHGDLGQLDREKALHRLANRDVRVLVATNVAARGLDIEDISHVVNYDMPRTIDEYVHRIGRTARATATGSAYTFVTPGDEAMVMRIETALDRTLPRIEAEGFNYDVPTPSWAQPSAKSVSEAMNRGKTPADVSRRIRFKR